MTSQPDKLFRDKLENFQRPAPAGAWNKIESNLSRPDKKIIWMRIAAGVALISAAAFVLWPAEKAEHPIAKKQDKIPVAKSDTAQQKILPKIEEAQNSKSSLAKTTHTTKKSKAPVPELLQAVKDSAIISVPEQKELIAEVIVTKEKESHSKTIVYTADVVNSKFLKKKLPPEATPESKDASGIQKLIGLAYAAKNSETGLGDLRQKKDDILALNFGKKKGEN